MNILKTASVVVVSSLMMVSTASISARAAMTGFGSVNADVAAASDRSSEPNVEHDWLIPSPENRRPQSMTCKPGHIFSQHDVVGDPESCIMQGGGFALGTRGVVTAPAL